MKTRHLEEVKRPAASKQKPYTAIRFPPGGRGKACKKAMLSNEKGPGQQAVRTKKPGLCLPTRESKPCVLPHRARAGRGPRRMTAKTRGEVAGPRKDGFGGGRTADARTKSEDAGTKRDKSGTKTGRNEASAGLGDVQIAGQNAP